MAERLKVSPLEASIILANEVMGGGQYNEQIARFLHGGWTWRGHYSGIARLIIKPEDFLEDTQRSTTLIRVTDQMLRGLIPRRQVLVGLRFGKEDGTMHTLREIGDRCGYTSIGGPRLIIARELRRLRHPSRSGELREFLAI